MYDALTSDRVCRPAYPDDIALDLMLDGRGTQFDPDVLDAFLATTRPELVDTAAAPAQRRPAPDEPPATVAIDLERLREDALAARAELETGGGVRRRIDAALLGSAGAPTRA